MRSYGRIQIKQCSSIKSDSGYQPLEVWNSPDRMWHILTSNLVVPSR